MKNRNRADRKAPAAAPPSRSWWPYAVSAAVLALALWAYAPSINGPFLFDDISIPYAWPGAPQPLGVWISGVRPALMLTYWLNAQLSGDRPFSFHVLNVLLHCVTSGLVFLIVRRLLEWSGTESCRLNPLSGLAAAIFLLHPLQTETVSYIAGRSEGQSVMFAFLALTLFLYRRQRAVSWTLALGIFLMFGLALLSKEQTVVLPGLMLLADYWWNPGFSFRGIRANWRLYFPLFLCTVSSGAVVCRMLATSQSAGFGLEDLTWYQYFFTQCRALFLYPGLFLFPANLDADWDFPFSRTILDSDAIFGLALLAGLVTVAWIHRHRYPLASFGFFAYLLLMSPTSSIVPLHDAIAERRVYFSMLGILLVVLEFVRRTKASRNQLIAGCMGVSILFAVATHSRAKVWSSAISLWEDTVRKSPDKARGHFQLGFAYLLSGRNQEAVKQFEQTGPLGSIARHNLLIDWALALDAMDRTAEALVKLQEAADIQPSAHVYGQIAVIHAKRAEWDQALQALARTENIDPNYAMLYVYRGKIHLRTNRAKQAVEDFQRALTLDPGNAEAMSELTLAQSAARQQEDR